MIFRKRQFWLFILIISIFCLGFQSFRPRYDQRFSLQYTLSPQVIELGEIQAATYTLSASYISVGDFAGGPDSKIEVFDSTGTTIYTNIYKNNDPQITPEFKLSEKQPLRAKIELADANSVTNASLELRLRHQDEPMHFRIFWTGVVGLFGSICALVYLRKNRS